MTSNRDFKGVWIPKQIWLDSRLSLNEKYYLAIYRQFGEIERETDRIMEQIASKWTICIVKKKLRELQLLPVVTSYEQARDRVLAQKGQGEECEWCGTKTLALQKHHYPIPQCQGGTETVNICPNCHYEFHALIKTRSE